MQQPTLYIQHVNLLVDDMAAADAFYGDFLGLERLGAPDQGFPAEFYRFNDMQELHVNELEDTRPVRAHFALRVPDFERLFLAAREAGYLETETWGRARRLPNGVMQGFIRDPTGNLIEITSEPDQEISDELFGLDEVDEGPGFFTVGTTAE
ncbi:MAG: VOC family protein [Actinomycetota bacterium]